MPTILWEGDIRQNGRPDGEMLTQVAMRKEGNQCVTAENWWALDVELVIDTFSCFHLLALLGEREFSWHFEIISYLSGTSMPHFTLRFRSIMNSTASS